MLQRFAVWILLTSLSGVAMADESTQVARVFTGVAGPDQPGCVVGVMRKGELIHSAAFGLADVARAMPMDTDTVVEIASVSKQFTAFAVLLLEQRRLLSLDDPLLKFLPELAGSARGVTLRHLLHHTGGLRDYIALMEFVGRRWSDRVTRDEAFQAVVRQQAPNFPPGERYEYSNTGYFLLSQVVERVSGQPFPEFARVNIFEPLKMTHTQVVDRFPVPIEHRARGYSRGAGDMWQLDESPWEPVGAGNVHTTVGDLARWEANFYQPKIGGATVIARMVEAGALASGERIAYASGLMIDAYRGLPTVYHSGWWTGFRSFFLRFPEQRFGVSVLCNRSDAPTRQLAQGVADAYLGSAMTAAQPPKSPLEDYVGTYWSSEAAVSCDLTLRNGAVTLGACMKDVVLTPYDENELISVAERITLRFTRHSGQPREFAYYAAGLSGLRFQRVTSAAQP